MSRAHLPSVFADRPAGILKDAIWHYIHTDPRWNSPFEVREFLYRNRCARESKSATEYAFPHAHLVSESRAVAFCREVLDRHRFPHLPGAIVTVFIRPRLQDLTSDAVEMLKRAFARLGTSLTVVFSFDETDSRAFRVWFKTVDMLGAHIAQLVLIGTNESHVSPRAARETAFAADAAL